MEEEPCDSAHDALQRRMASGKIRYDALQHRIVRFRDKVERANSDPGSFGDDLCYYTDEELILAYDEMEQRAEEVVEAYVRLSNSLRKITTLRTEIKSRQEQEKTRRNLGSDALRLGTIDFSNDVE